MTHGQHSSTVQVLYDFIVNMCSSSTINYEIMNSDIQNITKSIELEISNSREDKTDANTLIAINKCTRLLECITLKRLELSGRPSKLQIRIQQPSKLLSHMHKTACNGRVQKISDEKLKNDEVTKAHKRLLKNNLEILENWFDENFTDPYLDSASLEFLIRETGLSKSQIQNWVSNRRRKERNVKITPEIAELIA
uniref:MTLa2 n=1 Tax=Candida metapsilosis TaxID=273372 RepID=F1D912_9ASCO|nr:MTLa2 [Candida metapsilosis]